MLDNKKVFRRIESILIRIVETDINDTDNIDFNFKQYEKMRDVINFMISTIQVDKDGEYVDTFNLLDETYWTLKRIVAKKYGFLTNEGFRNDAINHVNSLLEKIRNDIN